MRTNCKRVLIAAFLLQSMALSAAAQPTISTVAGGGPPKIPAREASIGLPGGLAFDQGGNLYIPDAFSNRVYSLDSSGYLTVVAGNGGIGYENTWDAPTATELPSPLSVAFDPTGHMMVLSWTEYETKIWELSDFGPPWGVSLQPILGLGDDHGMFIDGAGNFFVADRGSNAVYELDQAGNQTLVAGGNDSGYSGDGGLAAAAQLNGPDGVALDANGNVFIADTLNNVIREVVKATGKIYTVYGDGKQGYFGDGGAATAAEFNQPKALSFDSHGNVFIVDTGNNAIREVTAATGKIKTVAGNAKPGFSGDGGPATSAMLSAPSSVLVDAAGNVFISDEENSVVREVFAASGNIATIAGNVMKSNSGNGDLATNVQFNDPSAVFLDNAGNLFIADRGNSVIREVLATNGRAFTVAGNNQAGYSGDGGPATSASLAQPLGVVADAYGNLFIADTDNHVVREVDAGSRLIRTIAGDGTPGFSGDNGPATSAQLNHPSAVWVDGNGNLYIADSWNNAIRVADKSGTIKTITGGQGEGYAGDGAPAINAQLRDPAGLFVDSSGNVFISDTGNNVVRKITAATGKIATVAGTGVKGSEGDEGPATSATLDTPAGVLVDGSGNIFIASQYGDVIREVTAADGKIHRVAGNVYDEYGYFAGPGFYGDGGPATSAQMDTPIGIAADRMNNLYIADSENLRIREVAGLLQSPPKVAASPPLFSPAPGDYKGRQMVTLSDPIAGANLYYTTDGSTPTASSARYVQGPIPVVATTTIKAIATSGGYTPSPVVTGVFTISSIAPAPRFSPPPAIYADRQDITISDDIPGAAIFYTMNGSAPSAASTRYTRPLQVTKPTILRAIAIASGGLKPSPTTTGNYMIEPVAAVPTFSPGSGVFFATPVTVTLSSTTPGAAIHYTTDGSLPTTLSPLYGKPISVTALTTISAIAVASGHLPSAVGAATYAFTTTSLFEQRAMAVQGMGMALAMQTFFSQLSMASPPLIGFRATANDGACSGPWSLIGANLTYVETWDPASTDEPAYATAFYDSKCTHPWIEATMYDWTQDFETGQLFATVGTKETANFIGVNGALLGAFATDEGLLLTADLSTASIEGKVHGLGSFVPANGAAPAKLGLTCTLLAHEFFAPTNRPVPCQGAIVQDFKDLNQSIGFVLPMQFAPITGGGVAWSGTQFVKVGALGSIFSSSDGTTWTPQTSGTTAYLASVIWAGTKFIAVGAGGTILTSPDGTHWTAQTSGAPYDLGAVAWSGSLAVAVGIGEILTSPDAIQWNAAKTGGWFKGVVWSGKLWVVVDFSDNVYTSPDTKTWTEYSPQDINARALAWSGSRFVVVGDNASLSTSTDGTNWDWYWITGASNLKGITWTGTQFITVGDAGDIWTSPTGASGSWTRQTSAAAYPLDSVAFSGTKYVAVGDAGVVLTSQDAKTWTPQTGAPGYGQAVTFQSAGSTVETGVPGSLTMTAPTIDTLQVSGGKTYGGSTLSGYGGDLSAFPPAPTGWTLTDAAHDQQFQITLVASPPGMFEATITQISTGKMLATATLDQSGTGTITYSDGSTAAVTDWLPAN